MENYFHPEMKKADIDAISILGLAHIGDGVFELLCRSWLCAHGEKTVERLHRDTIALVKAPAQAQAMEKLLPVLTEKELAVYKRGRNTKTHAAPNQATVSEYHAATGLETLFGYLYLQGDYPRVEELFRLAMED